MRNVNTIMDSAITYLMDVLLAYIPSQKMRW